MNKTAEINNSLKNRSVLGEKKAINQATTLIRMGARLNLLSKLLPLSYDRLSKLYREVAHRAPAKGLIPYSEEWYMQWDKNIHATLFYSLYEHVNGGDIKDPVDRFILAYRLYLNHLNLDSNADLIEDEPPLPLMRASLLISLFRIKSLTMRSCSQCDQSFVHYAIDKSINVSCGFCFIPPRAKHGIRQRFEKENPLLNG